MNKHGFHFEKARNQVINYLKWTFQLSKMEAEDIAHDAIYSYLLIKEQRSIDKPIAYIKQIAKNNFLMKQRHKELHLTQTKDVEKYLHKIPDENASEKEKQFILKVQAKDYGWQQLKDKCKKLLEAFYLKRSKLKELTRLFNHASVNSTKVQKSRCLAAIRKDSLHFIQQQLHGAE